MIGALALLATTTASASADVRVLVLPTMTLDRAGEARAVDEPARAAFDEAFRDAAEGTFLARRMQVVDPDETEAARAALLGKMACQTSVCAHELAQRTQATSWLASVVLRGDDHCRARATLFDMTRARVTGRRDVEIKPCDADALVRAAEDLGRAIADGPRLPVAVSLSLTPVTLPDLEIADVDDVSHASTSSTARLARGGMTLARALEVYRRNEFRADVNADGYVVALRGNTPIDDCALMVAAGRKATASELRACDGNWWELGYLTMPIGTVVLLPTLAADDPPLPALVGALALLVAGPALAIALNEDELDAAAGEHVVGADELAELLARANATLRNELGLTEAEVEVAGAHGP